jgi:hypothetical protein
LKKLTLFSVLTGFFLFQVSPAVSSVASLRDRHPVLSRYFLASPAQETIRDVARHFEIERREAAGFSILIPAKEKSLLLSLAPDARLIDADITAALRRKVGWDRAGWHNFRSVQSELDGMVRTYPTLASLEQYGTTEDRYPLKALRMTGAKATNREKPQLVITAATHGNELITVEVVLGLMNTLLKGYGHDARLTKMLDEHELYFIPVVNPDGYVRMERYCDGLDPNRDYPYPRDPRHHANRTVQAIMDFFAHHKIAGSLDYHSAAAMVMYPWAYTYDPVPAEDERVFDDLTTKMAATNGYAHGPISSTIYVAPGSSADYYYWKFHTRAIAIEIREDGASSLIPRMLRENTESTWIFIESF